jgi:hypothetical protein
MFSDSVLGKCLMISPIRIRGFYYSVKAYMYVSPASTINNSLFCVYGFHMISVYAGVISLNNINQLIFVMVKCCVFFAVRTELLNII